MVVVRLIGLRILRVGLHEDVMARLQRPSLLWLPRLDVRRAVIGLAVVDVTSHVRTGNFHPAVDPNPTAGNWFPKALDEPLLRRDLASTAFSQLAFRGLAAFSVGC